MATSGTLSSSTAQRCEPPERFYSALSREQMLELCDFLDSIPVLRQNQSKAWLNRDFADAVSAARLVHFFYPSHVELHNYERAPSSLVRRRANWETLNRKVLWKFELQLSDSSIDELALGKMGAVDVLLLRLMQRIRQLQMQMRQPPTTRRQKWLHQ